jgi:hypothetical protein
MPWKVSRVKKRGGIGEAGEERGKGREGEEGCTNQSDQLITYTHEGQAKRPI